MVKMLINKLRSDGDMDMIFRHFANETVRLERYGLAPLLRAAPHMVVAGTRAVDVGGRETYVTFPAFNAVQFRLGGGWRPFFVVHRHYGTGIRDCVRLGLEAWSKAKNVRNEKIISAYVLSLPSGVESGVEVQGVHLFEAEWMCANAVAVG